MEGFFCVPRLPEVSGYFLATFPVAARTFLNLPARPGDCSDLKARLETLLSGEPAGLSV
ncbi:MAG: hypothetical protein H7257_14370 [Taibaiella sp.]|nr:hypothetical protein [Taibaiella sp.]